MIIMLCGACQMEMMVLDIQYIPNSDMTFYKQVYHLGCENNHVSKIEGESIILKADSAEERVVKFLIEKSEIKYGKTISN